MVTCLLCYIAEEMDCPEADKHGGIWIVHSSDACIVYCLVVCLLIIVAGFRYQVGDDYMMYYNGRTLDTHELLESLKSLDEPGYSVLAWGVTRFIDDNAAVIFMASLVTILLPLIVIYRYSDRLLFPVFLYIVMGNWAGSFNGIRQYLAASVLLCGYRSLREKKLIEYCIIVLLAFLFHRSAIVFLFLYFVVNREINIPNILLLVVATGVLLISYNRIFIFANFIMESNYSLESVYTSTSVNRLRVLSACVPSVAFMLAYYGEEKNEQVTFAFNIIIIRSILSVMAMNSALLYRITIYLSLFTPLAITELLKGLSNRNRNTIMGGLVAMHMVMWWYEIYISSSLNNFQWIWERPVL